MRVLDSASGTELLADRDYGDSVYGLAFAPDGALVVSSWDGQLRRYGPDLKLPPLKRAAPDGKNPDLVAIDPFGKRVAVGYNEQPTVSILDALTLMPFAKGQTDDVERGDFRGVAWSRDGATLVAGGDARELVNNEWRRFLRRFHATGRSEGGNVAASEDAIMDIQPWERALLLQRLTRHSAFFLRKALRPSFKVPTRL